MRFSSHRYMAPCRAPIRVPGELPRGSAAARPTAALGLRRLPVRVGLGLTAALVALLLLLPARSRAANIWDGGGADAGWGTKNNWDNNTVPGATADVTFGTAFTSGTTVLLGGDRTANTLTINSTTDFSLNNNVLTLTAGDITRSAASGTTTINSGIMLGADGTWSIAGDLVVAGVVADPGGKNARKLTKSGAGTLTLDGTNTYGGDTTISAGVVRVGNNSAFGATGNKMKVTADEAAIALNGNGLSLANDWEITGDGIGTSGALRNLANNNTLSGAGKLKGNARTNSDAGTLSITGGVDLDALTLTIGGDGDVTISGTALSDGSKGGGGGLTKDGTGTLTLSVANNTYTGVTDVQAGTLAYGITNALPTAPVQVSGGTLDIKTFNDTVGAVTLTSGTIAGTSGVLTGASYAVESGTVSAILGGTGVALTKTTAGTVTLSGQNTYTGTTTASAGVLRLDNAKALPGGIGSAGGTSALTINGGVIGLGNGDFSRGLGTGATQVQWTGSGGFAAYTADRNVNLGGASAGVTWASGSFVPNGSALILGAADADQKVVFQNPINLNNAARTVQVDDGTATVDAELSGVISSTAAANGALIKTGAGTLLLSGASANTYTGATTVNAGELDLNKSSVTAIAGALVIGDGTGGANADIVKLLAANQIADTSAVTINSSGKLDLNSFGETIGSLGDAGAGGGNVALGSATLTFGDANNLTYSGVIAGTGGVTKQGAGTEVFGGSAANTYSGLTTVNAGELDLNKTAGLNAVGGNVTVGGGTLKWLANEQMGNSAALVLNSGTVNLNGKTETLGTFTNNGGTFSTGVGGHLIGTGSTVTWAGGTNTVDDGGVVEDAHIVISGGTNTVAGGATGGVLQLNASGTGLEMSAGSALTLNSDNAVAGRLVLKGDVSTSGDSTVTIASGLALAHQGNVDLNGGTRTFTVANGTAATDLSISAVVTNGSLTKAGAGTLTLSGTNTYTGVTTVNAGTLSVATIGNGGVAGNLGQASNAAGNLVLGGGTLQYTGATASTDRAFTLTGGTTSTLDVTTNTLTMSGASAATNGGLTKAGNGTLVLTGAQAYTGTTTISAGSLQLGNGGNTGSLSTGSAIVDNGNLTINRNNAVAQGTDFSGAAISGTGSFTQSGAGTTTLNAANTYTGVTTVNAGTLSVGTINNGGVAGNLGQASNAASNLVLGGGTLQYTGATASTDRAFTLATGTTSTIDVTANNLTISGASAATTGGLIKTGGGTLTLSGANAYSGATTIRAGSLVVGADAAKLGGALGANNQVFLGDGSTGAGDAPSLLIGGAFTVGHVITVGSAANTAAYNATLGGSNTAGTSYYGNNIILDTPATNYTVTLQAATGGTVEFLNTVNWTTNNKAIAVGSAGNTGTVKLSSTLATTGGVTVNYGTLLLGSSDRLGDTTPVSVHGGIFDLSTYSDTVGAVTLSNGGYINGSGTLTGTSYALQSGTVNANLGSGTVTVTSGTTTLNGTAAGTTVNISSGALTLGSNNRLADGATVTVSGTGSLNTGAGLTDTVSVYNMSAGSLAGTGTLTATTYGLSGGTVNANLGTGTMNVTGSTALNGTAGAGTVNLTSGTLSLGASDRLADGAAVAVAGGTLGMGAYSDTVGAVALTAGGSITGSGGVLTSTTTYDVQSGSVSAILGGTVGLNKTGGGTVTLSGANTYSGLTQVQAGTLLYGNSNVIDGGAVTVSGGTLDLATYSDTVGAVTLTSGFINGTGTLTGTSYDLQGGTVNANLGVGTITSSGNVALNGTTAAADVNVTGGTLTLGSAGRLAGTTPAVNVAGGAVLALGGNETVGSLAGAGSVDLDSYTLIVGSAGTSTVFSGDLSGTGGALTKTGAGTLTLSGTNTYTGLTSIEAGKLLVEGSILSSVDVGAGGTLGGSGTVYGDVTISGTHNPGSSPGLQTITGDLAYGNTAVFNWELDFNSTANRGTFYDAVNVAGDLSIDPGATMNLIFNNATDPSIVDWSNPFWDYDRMWQVYHLTGAGTTTGSFVLGSISNDAQGDLLADSHPIAGFELDQIGQDIYVRYLVPEPTSLLLVGVSSALLLLRRRRAASAV